MMENQMKVCFVTMAQFNLLWSKALPQERFTGELTTLSFMYKKYNTLFIVGRQEDFIANLEDVISNPFLLSEVLKTA